MCYSLVVLDKGEYMDRTWSEQQKAIFDWFQNGQGNLVVRARAGTGKTTTIIEALGHAPERKPLLCAFNKRIADELVSKLPRGEAKTLHSIGFSFIRRQWQVRVDNDRGWNIAKKVMGEYTPKPIVSKVSKLAGKLKNMFLSPSVGDAMDIAMEFDLTPESEQEEAGWTIERIAEGALECLKEACEPDGTIDFDDMVWLPVKMRWLRGTWDLVVVDEAQDMSAIQLLMAQGIVTRGGRIVVVGDNRQAIYGFRGADSNSLDRLKTELAAAELGLTTTYRCPKSVVALAAKLVPDYEAAENAPVGCVGSLPYESVVTVANAGDFILSRTNAPLVRTALKLLRAGRRTKIEGKDLGKGLLSLIRKLRSPTLDALMTSLNEWQEREVKRVRAAASTPEKGDRLVEVIVDKVETIKYLCEGLSSVDELEARIESLFADMEGHANGFIICSTVHKAKGLESERVFLLEDTFFTRKARKDDRPLAEEEYNIEYVAITRAKSVLTWLRAN
jgi:superfamily I DNA/RNA helicase